ncbi:hypothetical protein HRbin17_00009 [bacterium HR17]|uniref:Uncharacterized protein n=1 Tax=Candidatus Fervidibacter japonicus TaxID=2035412 RepID=A0A2H5X8J9_9BACT|nr:hypothetical protein HRbin17_00009 [bacterium HR17]
MRHGDPLQRELDWLAASIVGMPIALYALAFIAFVVTRAGFWAVGTQGDPPPLSVFTRTLFAIAVANLAVGGGIGWWLSRRADHLTAPLPAARRAFLATMLAAVTGLEATLLGVVAAVVTRTPALVTPYFTLTAAFFFVVWHLMGRGRQLIREASQHRSREVKPDDIDN